MQNSGIVIPTKSSKFYDVWVILYKLGVFFIFLLFGLLPFSKPYIGEFYLDLYKFVGLALIFTFLVFRRFKDGSEIKLIFLYFLWLSLARIIDGGILLDGAVGSLFDIIVCLPFLGFAIVIPAEKRLNWLDIIAIIYCAAYTVVGIICLYGTVNQITVMNYIKEGTRLYQFIDGRLYVLGENCNTVGVWYYNACLFLLYLFFRYKKRTSRFLIVLSFFICYLTLSLTFSRSSMVSFAVSMGMLVVLIAFHYLPHLTPAKKGITLVVLMCLCVPIAYKSFNVSASLLTNSSPTALEKIGDVYADNADNSTLNHETVEHLNNRGFSSSGRVELWKAAILSLLDDPGRIATGKADPIPMDLTNEYIEKNMPEEYACYGDRPNHHNAYLEFLMISGLPGFLVMMVFFVVLGIKMVRLFFSQTVGASLSIKVLIILLTGIMIYNLFETVFFHYGRLNTTIFCMVSGYIIAFEKELCVCKEVRK